MNFNQFLEILSNKFLLLKCLLKPTPSKMQYIQMKKLDAQKKIISEDPQNPILHHQLADIYVQLKKWYPAIAEYRTSIALGNYDQTVLFDLADAYLTLGHIEHAEAIYKIISAEDDDINLLLKVKKLKALFKTIEPNPLSNLNHNQYFRLKTITDHLHNLFIDSNTSVLDVGGGEGKLNLFIPMPKYQYALAEPIINGISGIDLPFPNRAFDAVVACHVIEHIPPDKRQEFIYQLCRTAKKYVLLLNPFSNPKSFEVERLQLVFELTKASWAKEHLDSTLPNLDELENIFCKRGLRYKIQPIGSTAATLAMVFLDHYALSAGCNSELKRIHKFFNTRFWNHIQNNDFPNDYLVEINVSNI